MWFPVDLQGWLREARTRKTWSHFDRVMDLRALLWEDGRLPPRRELMARWNASRRTVARHLGEEGFHEVIPDGIAKLWERRWVARAKETVAAPPKAPSFDA